jgi:hypothetical protein
LTPYYSESTIFTFLLFSILPTGGVAATDPSASLAYTNLDRKTNDPSAVMTVI